MWLELYKTKLNVDGSIYKHKARLVVKDYAQIPDAYYSDTFVLVACLDNIRLLFAIAAQMNWKVYKLYIHSSFLNGILY